MRRVLHDGQTPRPLQEKATKKSSPQSSQRTRAKPWARMPHSVRLHAEFGFSSLSGLIGDGALLQYLSPLGWEHINLTGDYLWRSIAKVGAGKFRLLRPTQ
jgi:hypothetical protein